MLTNELIGITDLVAVNLQCFGLIILGYLSRRFSLIGPEEAKGLNIFVSYFSLPAMIFHSLATMPLSNIDFNFVGSILLSKSIIFLAVLLITFVLSCKSCTKHYTTRRSAIYAIFCTQSNDFALGYPLLLSLYGNSKASLANYLYILAPIQLLILNPIALLLIEVSKNLEESHSSTTTTNTVWHRSVEIVKIIFQKIFINPIILATFLGIVVNLLNAESLPQVTVSFFEVLAQSFSSVALFLLGLNLHGNFKLLKNFSQPLLITLLLVTLKIFCMPLLNRFLVQHIRIFPREAQNVTLTEFAFLYGTFPAAPTVYIFSNIYNLETVIISTGLVISTLFSAPLMFVSANMIRLSAFIDYKLLNDDLLQTIFFTGVVSITGSVLLMFSFFSNYKLRSLTHCYSFKILASHLLVLFGGFLYRFNPKSFSIDSKLSLFQYLLFHVGLFSLKTWTCFLSLTLVLLYAKSLCYTVRISTRLLIGGLLTILAYAIFLACTFNSFPLQPSPSLLDLFYGINAVHMAISMCTSCFSIFTLIVSLVLLHHYKNTTEYQSLVDDSLGSDESGSEPVASSSSSSPSSHSLIHLPEELITTTTVESQPQSRQVARRLERRRTVSNSNTAIEVEDLFLTLPRSRVGDDFKDTCNDTCHAHCSASKSCGDRLRQYKLNIESAIEAVELVPSLSFPGEREAKDFHQIFHHMYLLLFLALSIVVHLVVEVYHFIKDESTAISVEIEFLDILLTFSQGFIMFIIFGFDIDMIMYKLSKLFTLSLRLNQIYLPPVSSLEVETVAICRQFREQHLDVCLGAIGFSLNREQHLNNHSNDLVFSGRRLIDWLLQKRLVTSREEGLEFGRRLLYGRVLEHITREHFFCDNTYYYRFIQP